jgi:hypothetical protein
LIRVKEKEINHPFRPSAQKRKGEDGKTEYVADEGGKGVQTVREIKVCINCSGTAKSSDKAVTE